MRIDEDGWNLHQRSESHRRFHVIGEVEERTSERPDFRDRHAIQRRCHPVFADTEMEIAPAVAPRLEIACAFKLQSGSVGGRKVCRSANQPRHILSENVENLARAVTRSNTLGISRKRRQILVPAIWKLAMLHPVDLVSKFGESLRVGVEQFFPIVAKLAAAFPDSLLKVFAASIMSPSPHMA